MARTDTTRQRLWWPLVLAALVPAVGCAVWLGLESLRAAPWAETPLNPSEAIVCNDIAQAIRRIEAGGSATTAYPVSAEGSGVPAGPMTPIEAAVRSGEDNVVNALLPYLGALSASERRRLICLALSKDDERSADALNGGPPAAGLCD